MFCISHDFGMHVNGKWHHGQEVANCNVIISMYGVVIMFFDQSSAYICCDVPGPRGGGGGGGGGGGVAPLNQVPLKMLLKIWQL